VIVAARPVGAHLGASHAFDLSGDGFAGRPGGKAIGVRNRLQGDSLNALVDDFAAHG
jgi:hypothetical protein